MIKKKTVSRAELQEKYDTLSVRAAAKHFGISVVQFYKLLDQAEIKRKMPRTLFNIVD